MTRIIFLIVVFLSISIKLFSQNQSNIETLKKIEYLYNHQDWKELIKLCSLEEDSVINDPKINLYLAISHYNLNEYRIANRCFEIAYKKDTSNFIKENFYNSLLLNNNIVEARKLSENITDSLFREEIGVRKNTFVISASALYGAILNNNYNNIATKNPNDTVFNNIYRNKINQYFAANVDLKLNSYYNLFFSFSRFNDYKTQSVALDTFNHDININAEENNIFFRINYNTLDIDWYVGLNIWSSQQEYNYFYYKDINNENYEIKKATRYISKMSNYLFANANYNFDYISLGLNFAYGDLFYNKQVQFGLNLKYYPFANNNLVLYLLPSYIKTKDLYYKYYIINYQSFSSHYNDVELITKFGFDVSLMRNFRASVSANFGGVNILHETPDFFIYNGSDEITSLYSIKLDYNLIDNLILFLNYSYSNQNHYYYGNDRTTHTQTFNYQSFLGGLKYSF